MREFITNLSSLYWWISVVIVGILINLLSDYLKDKLDARLSSVSSWWKKRSEEQKAQRLRKIVILRGDTHEQIMLAISEVRERVRAGMLTMFGIVLFLLGIGLTLLPTDVFNQQSIFARIINIAISFVGSVAFTSGILNIRAADDKNKLLEDARKQEKLKDGA